VNKPEPLLSFVRCFLVGLNGGFLILKAGMHMNESIKSLCIALDQLGDSVENSWTDNRSLNEAFGWHHPAINRKELAHIPRALAKRIRSFDLSIDDENILDLIDDMPNKISNIQTKTIPYFYNGHGTQAIPAYLATLDWITSVIEPQISWVITNDPKSMPPTISRRLQGLKAKIEEIDIDQEKLTNQITLINEATETAESLPADLHDLKEARKKVESINEQAIAAISNITNAKKESENTLKEITANKIESDKLIDSCEEAYRITTTKGLAGAFDQRATKLSLSMWVWVAGLLGSLGAAWHVGSERIVVLTTSLSEGEPRWGIILMHILLAGISVGAPLWFAWISTKQIAQRFRLAEDYGFKASVAKAYEGYRKEAARINPELESRLFESALTRLEEAPLRLVENTTHGSPWHEIVNSEGFKNALDNIPGMRDKVLDLANKVVDKTKKKESLHIVSDETQQQSNA
jgi:hypothetical protein